MEPHLREEKLQWLHFMEQHCTLHLNSQPAAFYFPHQEKPELRGEKAGSFVVDKLIIT